jgi:hypothetical protein
LGEFDVTIEGQISKPIAAPRMLAITAGALVAATLIMFGAVLPAEFNWDPLRLGKLSGLDRLWAPREVALDTANAVVPLAREYPEGFRSDVIEIPLRAGGDPTRGDELEYKVRMKKDATVIYSWGVAEIGKPEEFYFDFHGHTLVEGKDMTVATYKQATGTSANGALTAPFDGVHGWFFQNKSPNAAVVRVKVSGFYELIPPGDVGNDAGIIANVPADKAFGEIEDPAEAK